MLQSRIVSITFSGKIPIWGLSPLRKQVNAILFQIYFTEHLHIRDLSTDNHIAPQELIN